MGKECSERPYTYNLILFLYNLEIKCSDAVFQDMHAPDKNCFESGDTAH